MSPATNHKKEKPQKKKPKWKSPEKTLTTAAEWGAPKKAKCQLSLKVFFFFGCWRALHSIVCVGGGGVGERGGKRGRGSRESESSASSSSLSCRILVIYNVTFFAFCARIWKSKRRQRKVNFFLSKSTCHRHLRHTPPPMYVATFATLARRRFAFADIYICIVFLVKFHAPLNWFCQMRRPEPKSVARHACVNEACNQSVALLTLSLPLPSRHALACHKHA